jgi:small-conductance mechanosensitive channel
VSFDSIADAVRAWFLSSGIRILLIVILAVVALRVTRVLSRRIFAAVHFQQPPDPEKVKRAETLSGVLYYALRAVILAISALTVLRETGVDIGPVLAAAGVFGLAIGFGAQNMVKDVLSGFFLLLYDQIRVGDVVQIAGKGGLVESINLKMVRLRDLAGNVYFVPNGEIGVVTNMTKDFSQYVFDIGVAYRENVDEVMDVIREIDEGLRQDPDFGSDILEPIEILGVDSFADSAVIVKARTKTKPIKQWRVAREFNRRMKHRFDELNIEIPFPHVTLYMGEGKKGEAPPAHVKLEGLATTGAAGGA